jgi:hypothetical protein
VPEPVESEFTQFLTLYNKALTDQASRSAFITRYRAHRLSIHNAAEVTRAGDAPIFTDDESGDLLAIPGAQVTGKNDYVSYLVPSPERKWTNDRVQGGAWDYFFDIHRNAGVSRLKEPAVVQAVGGSWKLVDGHKGALLMES